MTRDEKILAELTAMREKLDTVHDYVVGKPGLHGLVAQQELLRQRTSVLEQNHDRRRKVELGAIVSVVGLMLERFWRLITEP